MTKAEALTKLSEWEAILAKETFTKKDGSYNKKGVLAFNKCTYYQLCIDIDWFRLKTFDQFLAFPN